MSVMRAKFKVGSLVENTDSTTGEKNQEQVHLHAVYSSDPESENAKWSKWTPAGSMNITINNPGAFGILKANQEYFLDFTPVEGERVVFDKQGNPESEENGVADFLVGEGG